MAIAFPERTPVQIGKHDVLCDGVIVTITVRGRLTLEQMREILGHYDAQLQERGFVLILVDVSKAAEMDQPARKVSAEWAKTYGDRSRSAVVGAPFVIRTAVDLINRAANALAKRKVPLGFFATEEEARRWLIAQIPILQQAAVPR